MMAFELSRLGVFSENFDRSFNFYAEVFLQFGKCKNRLNLHAQIDACSEIMS